MAGLTIAIIFMFFDMISKNEGNVVVHFNVYNYRNVFKLLRDGSKCDKKCDSVFTTCIRSLHKCDILQRYIATDDEINNLPTVFSKRIELQRFPRSISVDVRVEHFDDHNIVDHIAVFFTHFVIDKIGYTYHKVMKAVPQGLDVGMQANVTINCAKDYYGPKCNQSKMEIECIRSCGHGRCSFNQTESVKYQKLDLRNSSNMHTALDDKKWKKIKCLCDKGWSGPQCRTFLTNDCSSLKCQMDCNVTGTLKECVCINTGNYTKLCLEKSSFHSERNLPMSHLESTFRPDLVKNLTTHLVAFGQINSPDSRNLTNMGIKKDGLARSTIVTIGLLLLGFCVLCLLVAILMFHYKAYKNDFPKYESRNKSPLKVDIYPEINLERESYFSNIIAKRAFISEYDGHYLGPIDKV